MALVLILEDDPTLRFAFCEAVEAAGLDVISAASVGDATALLRRYRPDVLLLDLMVGPDCSTDVADYAAVAAPSAAVIYITGSRLFPRGEIFDMSRNARLMLRKPVNLEELADMVQYVVPRTAADLRAAI
ncbi:MAG: response regulator [Pseudomonadota bacterium]